MTASTPVNACRVEVGGVQGFDLRRQRDKVTIIRDDVVSGRPAPGPIGLCGKDRASLGEGRAVACLQSADLRRLIGIDDQYPIDASACAALDQEWNGEDLVGPACTGRARVHFGADRGMGQGLEPPSRIDCFSPLAEDACAQRPAVERAIGRQDLLAELRANLPEECRARCDHVAGDDIGVDDRHAESRKEIRHGALAARDATGEADAEHGSYRRASVRCVIATSRVIVCAGTACVNRAGVLRRIRAGQELQRFHRA